MEGDTGPRCEPLAGFCNAFRSKGLGLISRGQANQDRQAPTTARAKA